MPSTPSSTDTPAPRRFPRGRLVALIVVSVAVPGAALAVILHAHHSSSAADTATAGPLITPKRAKIGSVAPDFTLSDLNGQRVTLSGLRGRAVVLTFFASWCHPCEADMPVLEKAQRADPNHIAVVGVNYQDFPNDTRGFVQRLGVTFPTLIEDSTANPVAARYDVHAMPDTVFIDAQGVVRGRVFGQTNTHDLESALHALLASAIPPSGSTGRPAGARRRPTR